MQSPESARRLDTERSLTVQFGLDRKASIEKRRHKAAELAESRHHSPEQSEEEENNESDKGNKDDGTPRFGDDGEQGAKAHHTVRRYIEQLSIFIPGRIINHYVDRAHELTHEPMLEMFTEELEGAVLFADISGFSGLAEDLEKGNRVSIAANKLSQEVGGALGPLVRMILEWGGDVIKFAGDAIFAVFTSTTHGNMENAVAAACLAARKLVKFCLYNLSSGVKLELHCGIGAGKIVGLHVGGVNNRWEYAITGQPVLETISAEGDAGRGEVVVSGTVQSLVTNFISTEPIANSTNFRLLSMLGEELGGTEIRNNRLSEELKKLDPDTLHRIYVHLVPYVPNPVIESLNLGEGSQLAEVRLCVTLFIKLRGLPFDTVEDMARVHTTFRTVQKQMFRYRGATLCRLIVDDKGLTNLWAFGMPPHTFFPGDDHAERAVMAALGLHETLALRGLSCSIGITAGRVFCGTVGGQQRSEYTLHGTQVNLAARLMGKAGNGVLCDAHVFSLTQESIEYDAPWQVKVKGKEHEISVYRPVRVVGDSDGLLDAPKLEHTPSFTASSFHNLLLLAEEAVGEGEGNEEGADLAHMPKSGLVPKQSSQQRFQGIAVNQASDSDQESDQESGSGSGSESDSARGQGGERRPLERSGSERVPPSAGHRRAKSSPASKSVAMPRRVGFEPAAPSAQVPGSLSELTKGKGVQWSSMSRADLRAPQRNSSLPLGDIREPRRNLSMPLESGAGAKPKGVGRTVSLAKFTTFGGKKCVHCNTTIPKNSQRCKACHRKDPFRKQHGSKLCAGCGNEAADEDTCTHCGGHRFLVRKSFADIDEVC